jgi:hypothetical protein
MNGQLREQGVSRSSRRVRFSAMADNKLALVVAGGVLAMIGPVAAAQIAAGAQSAPTPSVTIFVQSAPGEEFEADASSLQRTLAGAPPDALRQLARALGVSSPQRFSTEQLVKEIVVEAASTAPLGQGGWSGWSGGSRLWQVGQVPCQQARSCWSSLTISNSEIRRPPGVAGAGASRS